MRLSGVAFAPNRALAFMALHGNSSQRPKMVIRLTAQHTASNASVQNY